MQTKISIQLIAPDKAIKQSGDLKCVFVFGNLIDIHIIEVQTEQDLKAKEPERVYVLCYLANEIPDRLHSIHLNHFTAAL